MKYYDVQWVDRVERSVIIHAETKEEALSKWQRGLYNSEDVDVNDTDLLSDYLTGGIEILEEGDVDETIK